jgi:hypothetical protein
VTKTLADKARYARQRNVLRVMKDLHLRERELDAELRRVHASMARYAVKGRDEGLSVRQLADASGRSKTWIGECWTKAQAAFDEQMGK